MRRTARRLATGILAAAALTIAGCAGSDDTSASDGTTHASSQIEQSASGSTGDAAGDVSGTSDASGSTEAAAADDELSGTLTVFAAASLKATFDQLREIFEQEHPGVDFPDITYEGSPTLVTQIRQGAPADVFASADENNMDKLDGDIDGRVDFVTNTLQIAVAPGNPKGIDSLADMAADGVISVICAPEVPCGAASHKALDAAGVALTPASEEENVKAVLTKVVTGDADAGLVYRTDVVSADGQVEGIDFPEAAEAVNVYPVAILKDSENRAAAQAFIDLLRSAQGQAVFTAVGFGQL